MCGQSATAQNSPTVLTPAVVSRMPWHAVDVQPLDGYRLRVRFVDGLEGEIDLSARIRSPQAGVFARLADTAEFNKVQVVFGVVTWPDETDLAPETIRAAIEATGCYVAR